MDPYWTRISCHFRSPFDSKSFRIYGGDDGARTRDLCRDSLARTGFTTTYKTREERPDIRKSPWVSIPVGWVVGWKIRSASSLYFAMGRAQQEEMRL